jgi:uncharacterized protein (DUF4415 family)
MKKKPNPHKAPNQKEWDAMGSTMHGIDALPKEARMAVKRSVGRPPIENPKQQLTLRIDPDVIERFKAQGAGWMTQMTDALARAAARLPQA